MQRVVEHLLSQHQATDQGEEHGKVSAARERQLETLKTAIEKVEGFLAKN